jgi:hypothetical protein
MSQQSEQNSSQNDDIAFEINTDVNDFEINDLQNDEHGRQSKKSSSTMKKIMLIVSGAILLIAGFVCYMLFFQAQFVEQNFPFLAKNKTTIIPSNSVLINSYQSFDVQNLPSEKQLLARISENLNPKPQPIVVKPVPRIVTRGFIQTPCWVIIVNTFAVEVQAIKTVAHYAKKGILKCGYFWAPDYIPGAQGNFKIYLGYFNSSDEAQQHIENEPAIAELFPNYTIQKLQ